MYFVCLFSSFRFFVFSVCFCSGLLWRQGVEYIAACHWSKIASFQTPVWLVSSRDGATGPRGSPRVFVLKGSVFWPQWKATDANFTLVGWSTRRLRIQWSELLKNLERYKRVSEVFPFNRFCSSWFVYATGACHCPSVRHWKNAAQSRTPVIRVYS